MSATLVEIQTQWSINDLADAHEMISWRNASTLDAQRKQDLERKVAAAGQR